MSRQQLPQRQVPLLPGNGGRKKGGVKITTILGFTFMAGLICSIVGVGAIIVFPEIGIMIRTAIGLPAQTNLPQASPADTTGLELTAQVIGLTQTALAQNPLYPSNTPFLPSSLPTYTPPPPLPTYTFPPSLPTYTPLPPLPTYTPYPSSAASLPQMVQSPTFTLEPNLIFSDTFDNVIAPGYWQQFGTWIISDGYPLLVEGYQPSDSGNYNIFYGRGGLIFPGTSQLDNIAIEFDFGNSISIDMLLSYKDEHSHKRFTIDYISRNPALESFQFVSKGSGIGIPQSNIGISTRSPNRVRVEIRGNSLMVYVNSELKYNFKDLPEKVTGTIGFATSYKTFVIDNFKIYQLP